jgi:prepilin-type N-terminal cleavage/methylation domain-containing protein
MLRRPLFARARSERGFTLIELLVVILVIGILAAIALPVFISQAEKSYDTSAKANARNLQSKVELCFAPEEDFTKCDTEAELLTGGNIGVPYGSDNGQAEVTGATKTTYTVTARSEKPDSEGVVHTFVVDRDIGGTTARTCTASNGNDAGGCRNGTW